MSKETKETKKTKEVNPNLRTEAYKLNLDIESERIIYEELLQKSNNKSGLVKDALNMYLVMVKKHGYPSPFLSSNTVDWSSILNNSGMVEDLGLTTKQVKQQVIQQAPAYREPVKEDCILNINDFDYEDEEYNDFGDDDNDVDF